MGASIGPHNSRVGVCNQVRQGGGDEGERKSNTDKHYGAIVEEEDEVKKKVLSLV